MRQESRDIKSARNGGKETVKQIGACGFEPQIPTVSKDERQIALNISDRPSPARIMLSTDLDEG